MLEPIMYLMSEALTGALYQKREYTHWIITINTQIPRVPFCPKLFTKICAMGWLLSARACKSVPIQNARDMLRAGAWIRIHLKSKKEGLTPSQDPSNTDCSHYSPGDCCTCVGCFLADMNTGVE